MGAALLDLDQPWKVMYRSAPYLMAPQTHYENVGDVPNVVFPCAALVDASAGRVAIYYGAADTVTGWRLIRRRDHRLAQAQLGAVRPGREKAAPARAGPESLDRRPGHVREWGRGITARDGGHLVRDGREDGSARSIMSSVAVSDRRTCPGRST